MAFDGRLMVPLALPGDIGQLGSLCLCHLGDKSVELRRFNERRLADEVVAYSQRRGFRAARDVQLTEDVADMRFDGGWADDEFFGDLGVVQTFDHQSQHSALTLCQVVTRRWRLGGRVD